MRVRVRAGPAAPDAESAGAVWPAAARPPRGPGLSVWRAEPSAVEWTPVDCDGTADVGVGPWRWLKPDAAATGSVASACGFRWRTPGS